MIKRENLTGEDIGVYVVFALLGAGLGLLAGAGIASLVQKRQIITNEQTEDDEEVIDETTRTKRETDEASAPVSIPDRERSDNGGSGRINYSRSSAEKEDEEVKEIGLDPDTLAHLSILRSKYNVRPQQEYALLTGEVTIEELESELMDEQEEELDETNIEVTVDKPSFVGYTAVKLGYYFDEDVVKRYKRGKPVSYELPENLKEVIDVAIERLMWDDIELVYMIDHSAETVYHLKANRPKEE